MAKQGGMGDYFLVDQYNVSGGIGSLGQIGGGPAPSDVTDITQSAVGRIGLLRDGRISASTWFDPAVTVGAEGVFTVLKTLPMADRQLTYFRGSAVGNPAASMISKQVNFDGTRGQDGSFTFAMDALGNGFGLEWGEALTTVMRTDTAATNGTSIDLGAVSTLFGASAYLHVTSFTGTSVVIKIQDSADNATFADVTGLTFTTVAGRTQERLSTGTTATIRRYVRIITSTGTFTNVQFAANFVRYPTAQS